MVTTASIALSSIRQLIVACKLLNPGIRSILSVQQQCCSTNNNDQSDELALPNNLNDTESELANVPDDERPILVYNQKALQTLKLDQYPYYVEREWWKHGARMTFWSTWRMKRDVIQREYVAKFGPERLRLKAIKCNTILPQIMRDECAQKLHSMPKKSIPKLVKHLCQFSGAKRGKLNRFHLHRQIFRNLADHGKLSGVQRAMW